MKLEFYCPLWGRGEQVFAEFCRDVRNAGYDGVELPFPMEQELRRDMTAELRIQGLRYIAQHWETFEPDFRRHLSEYESRLYALADTEPEFISSQTGRDWFSFEQNLEILDLADRVSRDTGVKILHETHRSKMLFAAHIARTFLNERPDLRLTLDISHWCTVAETMLEDQKEAVDLALERTDHIHARVGFIETPQVTDPFAPEWKDVLDRHMIWWSAVIDRARREGREKFTITNEFGPYPYMTHLPYSGEPLADQWEINVKMKNMLFSAL